MIATLNIQPDIATRPAATDPTAALDLAALYPACFDPGNPRPLKLGIHKDLIAIHKADLVLPEGTTKDQRDAARWQLRRRVKEALGAYCTRPEYLRIMVLGDPRIDLRGRPVGAVSEREAAIAAMRLRGETAPPHQLSVASTSDLPEDAALAEENIVSGHLEITLKFNRLPQPMAVKAGMKIGVQTDSALVVTTLLPKTWKKLTQAATAYPQWMASITGTLAAKTGADGSAVMVLEEPALQVFEKKAKPSAPTGAA